MSAATPVPLGAAGRFSWAGVLLPVAAVAGALLLGAALMALARLDPVAAYRALWLGAFGSVRSLAETLVRFCPLALAALAVLVAFRAGFFTIGVDGQFALGALGATSFGVALPDWPAPLLIPACALSGLVAGMGWALVAGLLKHLRGVNEVISTIMLNTIANLFVDYMVRGPLRAPDSDVQITSPIGAGGWLPILMPHTRLHAGVLFPLVAAGLLSLLLWRTRAGFELRIAGANPTAGRHAGIDVGRRVLLAVAISGALAGLAGAIEVQGVFHRLQGGIASDYGFTAIPIALVGKVMPGATLVAALFFAALSVGATMMQLKAAVPLPVVLMLQGFVVLLVVGSEAVRAGGRAHVARLWRGWGRPAGEADAVAVEDVR